MKRDIKPHLALIGTNVFFAINFTAVKYLINGNFILPFGLNFIRMLITAILLWFFYFFQNKKEPIQKIHFKRFFICALLGIVINQLLFIKGLSLTYSIHASLLMLTTPIFITIIAAWILKEKLSFNKILGLTLGVTGAVVLMLHKKNSGSGSNVLWGDILVILNAISYSYYFVLVKPLMKRYHPITVMRILFTMGVFIAFPFCWSEFTATPWTEYHSTQFAVLFLIIFCGTFLAYTFNVYGIKHLGASVSGAYIYSQPIFASIIAILMLGEVLDMYKIISAALIFVGVFLNNKSVSND